MLALSIEVPLLGASENCLPGSSRQQKPCFAYGLRLHLVTVSGMMSRLLFDFRVPLKLLQAISLNPVFLNRQLSLYHIDEKRYLSVLRAFRSNYSLKAGLVSLFGGAVGLQELLGFALDLYSACKGHIHLQKLSNPTPPCPSCCSMNWCSGLDFSPSSAL